MAENQLAKAQELLKEIEDLAGVGLDVGHAIHNKASEASDAGRQALVMFRQEKNLQGRTNSLEALVKACLQMGDLFDAQRYAQDELQMLKKENIDDKAALAFVTEQVVKVLTIAGDVELALDHAQELLDLQRVLGSQEGEARALLTKAELKRQNAQFGPAIEAGEAAVKLYAELKDGRGKEQALRTISRAFCDKGTPDKAPGREQALKSLEQLQKALKGMRKGVWIKAYEELDVTGACVESDWDFIPQALAAAEDKRSMFRFLEQCGVDTHEWGGHPRILISSTDEDATYQKWRTEGIGYGPHFRFLRQSHLIGLESEAPKFCASVLQTHAESDDWDTEFIFSQGMIEGMVQCGQTYEL
eukprot:CAMPEP_0171095520 /NCGR_PEP_ID=MMETSP0766_2-20121228/43216_1 /TAXON_ID=439317 /ORGANISM="Gambierdiscus australes, Strain CAWD 149" /LENGTH=358 /DNA_ID=CAMNT_0011554333 /DNA_START=34 /DNA_END=1110 /DNA_ORIENTATION=-